MSETIETICTEGVLRDDDDRQPSERQSQQQRQRSPGMSRTSDGHDQPPARARKSKRQKSAETVETLTYNLSNVSLSEFVDAYIRRNISKPKMAKRNPDYGESRSSSRLSVEKFSQVIDDTDALFV